MTAPSDRPGSTRRGAASLEHRRDQAAQVYREIRARIVSVRDQMDALRRELDTRPVRPDGRFSDGTCELD